MTDIISPSTTLEQVDAPNIIQTITDNHVNILHGATENLETNQPLSIAEAVALFRTGIYSHDCIVDAFDISCLVNWTVANSEDVVFV